MILPPKTETEFCMLFDWPKTEGPVAEEDQAAEMQALDAWEHGLATWRDGRDDIIDLKAKTLEEARGEAWRIWHEKPHGDGPIGFSVVDWQGGFCFEEVVGTTPHLQ